MILKNERIGKRKEGVQDKEKLQRKVLGEAPLREHPERGPFNSFFFQVISPFDEWICIVHNMQLLDHKISKDKTYCLHRAFDKYEFSFRRE